MCGNSSWEIISRHYLPKGLIMLFLLTVTVIAFLVNELPRKMIKYQVIIFTQRIRQAKLRFPGGPRVVVEQRKTFLVAFNFDYKYLDSFHIRPPVIEKRF